MHNWFRSIESNFKFLVVIPINRPIPLIPDQPDCIQHTALEGSLVAYLFLSIPLLIFQIFGPSLGIQCTHA